MAVGATGMTDIFERTETFRTIVLGRCFGPDCRVCMTLAPRHIYVRLQNALERDANFNSFVKVCSALHAIQLTHPVHTRSSEKWGHWTGHERTC